MRVQCQLLDYSVNSVTEGIEALATTRVVIKPAGKLAGEGYVTDTKVGLGSQGLLTRTEQVG